MLSSKQQQYIKSILNPKHEIIVADGAIRVGKTEIGATTWAKLIDYMSYEKGAIAKDNQHLLVASSKMNAFINVGLTVVEELRLLGHKIITSSPDLIETDRLMIRIFGVNNKKSFVLIKGFTGRTAFIDEAALLVNEKTVNTIIDRTLTYSKGALISDERLPRKIILTTNCEGSVSHWFYQSFIKHGMYCRLNFHLLDNPVFNQSHVDKYKAVTTHSKFQRDIEGKWVRDDGGIYPQLPKTYDYDIPDFEYIVIGEDEGRSDKLVAYATGFKNGVYYTFDRVESSHPEGYVPRLIDYKNFLTKIGLQFPNTTIKVNNETSPGIAYDVLKNDLELPNNLYITKVNKGKRKTKYRSTSAINQRIDAENVLIAQGKHYVHSGRCDALLVAMESAVRDTAGNRVDDGSYSVDDLDAYEYSVIDDVKIILDEVCDIFKEEND